MFSEYKDEEHRRQAEEILLVLGRFTVQFERMCEAMRHAITLVLRSQGLKNYEMQQVIVGNTSSAQLQVLLGALCNHIPEWDEADRLAVKNVLKEVKELTESRNVMLHSAWQFGDSSSGTEFLAVAIRQRTKQTSGAVSEVWGVGAKYLEELIQRMRASQVLLQRLVICINQSFKPALKLAEPL